MPKEEQCLCPLCKQRFTPKEGLTPEEHLAQGIISAFGAMQEAALSCSLPCPRCGRMRMNTELAANAVSRQADIYICNMCGADEALRATRKDELPITAWYIADEILKSVPGTRCEHYIPEKNNPYPLCDNPACEEAGVCNISAHMNELS